MCLKINLFLRNYDEIWATSASSVLIDTMHIIEKYKYVPAIACNFSFKLATVSAGSTRKLIARPTSVLTRICMENRLSHVGSFNRFIRLFTKDSAAAGSLNAKKILIIKLN
jgi:hypothetical protein